MSSVVQRGDSSSSEPCVRESAVLSDTTIDDRIDASTPMRELHRSSTVLTPRLGEGPRMPDGGTKLPAPLTLPVRVLLG